MAKVGIPLNGDYTRTMYRKYLERVNNILIPTINADRCCHAEKDRPHPNKELAGAGDPF